MTKAFSVASWNVEHFGIKGTNQAFKKPIAPIIDFLAGQNADVVALYEVRSSDVFRPIIHAMPEHQFYITEGTQTQEILIGIRKNLSVFVTQKLEFKSSQPGLRPGVLVTVKVDDAFYPLLFLHLKSLSDPKGFGLRDSMLQLALKFRQRLNAIQGEEGVANYLFVGDLNTMGLDYPYSQHDISSEAEIAQLQRRAKHHTKKMRVLNKNKAITWWAGTQSDYQPADLDHVVAAEHLQFKSFAGSEVDIRGWPNEETDAEKDAWIEKYSDHALLYFEVGKI